MEAKKTKIQILSLISGKGGAGKTILGLSIAKILSEAEYKVLFIDADFATHGASYFMENELSSEKKYLSLANIINDDYREKRILMSSYGFAFIPSTLNPAETKHYSETAKFTRFPKKFLSYDFVIFDCQAGYNPFTENILSYSNKNIAVLEADAVSSSALRVLYLQLSKFLNPKNTWQIFNKLTEEERNVYGKITDGTFFPNLPPVPFDWKVRSAFALGKIPSLFEKDSAFGLAVLRFLKILLINNTENLQEIEQKAVGDWYDEIVTKIKDLQKEKELISDSNVHHKRKAYTQKMTYIATILGLISTIIAFSSLFDYQYYMWIGIGIVGIISSIFIQFSTKKQVAQEAKLDKQKRTLSMIEDEIQHLKTLVNTDNRLNEYLKIALLLTCGLAQAGGDSAAGQRMN